MSILSTEKWSDLVQPLAVPCPKQDWARTETDRQLLSVGIIYRFSTADMILSRPTYSRTVVLNYGDSFINEEITN
jgi:hypothetical protein